MKIIEAVKKLAEPVIERLGLELWDVEYVKEAGEWYLRIYIDKDGGISINDCENVSRELDPLLDEQDLIPETYTFEVSSAGAERPLKTPDHFKMFIGSLVVLRLYSGKNGKKEYKGLLTGYKDGEVTIDVDGTEETFGENEVALVRLSIG